MKLAVITLYDYYNYGSYLQAWAMQTYLESLGHEVYFVKTQPLRRRIRRGLLSDNTLIFDIKKMTRFQKALFQLRQIDIADFSKMGIEAVIIGSDELWNADNDSFNQYPYYYGIGYNLPTLVYAMSLGNGNYNTLLKREYISTGIRNLKHIYARDKSAAEAIGRICERKIDLVCDPVLLAEKETYMTGDKAFDIEPYILVYSYDMPAFLQEYVRKYADEKRLKVVSACFQMACADKVINCNPLRFPQYVERAEVVITSTFHGSVFSVLFNKTMVVLPYARKTTDFLEQMRLNDRVVAADCSYSEFREKVRQCGDFSHANHEIAILRKKSKQVMDGFLTSV